MDAEELQSLFGRRVQALRRERGLTQEELAETTQLSVEYISKIERGLASPSVGVIARLIDVLEAFPSDLFRALNGEK